MFQPTQGDNFIVNYVYPVFQAKNDFELLNQMLWIFIFYTLSVVLSMLVFPAPYGRYSNKSYGFLIPGKLAWATQESPSFIVPIILLLTTSSSCWESSVNKILLSCYILHYIQRSIVFPLTLQGGKPTPFTPYISAFIFCVFNGFFQGHYLLNVQKYNNEWLYSLQFIAGITLFAIGMLINIHSDQILTRLRQPGETGYKIPTGGMFEYVTGANYMGEIIEWAGFFLASGSSAAGIFAVFSASFLGLRAWHHHKFYLSKFEDYPANRKIIIPFIL